MEVAGLAVGVPPLLALTLDTYRQTYDAFRTFRHRHEEIRSLQRQLKIQERLFRTECSLLILWLIKDDDLTDRLLDDIRSQLWNEESILSLARRSLGESHDYYTDALDEVCGILNKVRKDLRSFDHKVSQNRGDIVSQHLTFQIEYYSIGSKRPNRVAGKRVRIKSSAPSWSCILYPLPEE